MKQNRLLEEKRQFQEVVTGADPAGSYVTCILLLKLVPYMEFSFHQSLPYGEGICGEAITNIDECLFKFN